MILNGKALDYVCNAENLGKINDDISTIEDDTGADLGGDVTEENCKYGGKYGIIADFTLKTLFDIYFVYVLMRWTKHDDDYHK